jgi:hypothetical protein
MEVPAILIKALLVGVDIPIISTLLGQECILPVRCHTVAKTEVNKMLRLSGEVMGNRLHGRARLGTQYRLISCQLSAGLATHTANQGLIPDDVGHEVIVTVRRKRQFTLPSVLFHQFPVVT